MRRRLVLKAENPILRPVCPPYPHPSREILSLIANIEKSSVADPDPPDPHVFGLPGSLVRGMDPYPSIIKQQ